MSKPITNECIHAQTKNSSCFNITSVPFCECMDYWRAITSRLHLTSHLNQPNTTHKEFYVINYGMSVCYVCVQVKKETVKSIRAMSVEEIFAKAHNANPTMYGFLSVKSLWSNESHTHTHTRTTRDCETNTANEAQINTDKHTHTHTHM